LEDPDPQPGVQIPVAVKVKKEYHQHLQTYFDSCHEKNITVPVTKDQINDDLTYYFAECGPVKTWILIGAEVL
jgi:hypothetical protein